MRKIVLYILLLWSATLFAQELSVKSFKEKINDLSASTYSRLDNNGNPCALIKVQLATAGAQFEPNVMGNVDYKVNEYWVYLPTMCKHLKIKHPNFLTYDLIFSDYGVSALQSKTTYELILSIPDGRPTNKVISSQYLVFQVEPVDAIVEVNAEIWQNVEGTARKFVPFGNYNYSIQCKDYYPQSSSVTVNDPYNKVLVNIKLNPAFGSFSIPSTNSLEGATVYIDDKLVGKVPLKIDKIASGVHKIRIAKQLYKSYEQMITINDGELLSIKPDLSSNYSVVTFNVDGNAEIWINDEKKGNGTWTGNLEGGDYKVETRKENHLSQSKVYTILISSDIQQIKLSAPIPIYGSLNISSNPEGSNIYIDKKRVGESPLFLQQILIGEHELQFEKEGYKKLTKKVNVEESKITEISEILTKFSSSKRQSSSTSRVYANRINLVRAGQLSSALEEIPTPITELSISGLMDARDFNYIKNYCKKLSYLDLSGVKIVAYSGTSGTDKNTTTYQSNEVPLGAFFYWEPIDDGMPSLKEITLPIGITNIRRNAFARAYNLTKINIPEGVKTIDFVSFAICTSLETIELPSTLREVGRMAFASCSKLSYVYINSLTPPTIASDAFSGIKKDAILYVPEASLNTYRTSQWNKFFTIKAR